MLEGHFFQLFEKCKTPLLRMHNLCFGGYLLFCFGLYIYIYIKKKKQKTKTSTSGVRSDRVRCSLVEFRSRGRAVPMLG